jgi:hypothetical protein
MNNEDHEGGVLRSPLIFTVPAYPFVVAKYFVWPMGPTCRITHRPYLSLGT